VVPPQIEMDRNKDRKSWWQTSQLEFGAKSAVAAIQRSLLPTHSPLTTLCRSRVIS